jgi:hypothetical protein
MNDVDGFSREKKSSKEGSIHEQDWSFGPIFNNNNLLTHIKRQLGLKKAPPS